MYRFTSPVGLPLLCDALRPRNRRRGPVTKAGEAKRHFFEGTLRLSKYRKLSLDILFLFPDCSLCDALIFNMSFRVGSQRIGSVLRTQRSAMSQAARRSYASTSGSNLPESMRQEIEVRSNGRVG